LLLLFKAEEAPILPLTEEEEVEDDDVSIDPR
jgi:hypothetical protein